MKKLFVIAILAAACVAGHAQSKSNAAITRQIKDLGSGKEIKLTYDPDSNVSKLMGISENFSDTGRSGVQAMNFAIGFMYAGNELSAAPANVLLTFWVLTKRPRFAEQHNLILRANGRDLGPGRYAAKPREDMEYLNFEIQREDLVRMATETNSSFDLGAFQFSFSRDQQKLIADVLALSDPAR